MSSTFNPNYDLVAPGMQGLFGDPGFNLSKRDPGSAFTENYDLGGGTYFHDTMKFDAQGDIIGKKPHTTFFNDLGQTKRANW